MNSVNKDDLIGLAIYQLKAAKKKSDIESVELSTFNHDDGTSKLTISITYPIKDEVEEFNFYD